MPERPRHCYRDETATFATGFCREGAGVGGTEARRPAGGREPCVMRGRGTTEDPSPRAAWRVRPPYFVGRDGLMRKVLATALLFFVVFFVGSSVCFAEEAEVTEVEPEVVTGSRIYSDLYEVPAPTYVITAEEIRQSGATDLGS
ncbi:MAG: TonB-dependent receptor plug [Synergistales bacterium 57_84]|nr:MAG: TonB-dependent receptor plug [Synergistales bacterium 57_84]